MGFWDELKKKAEGVVAQINPLDGGKNYASVVNGAPTKKPSITRSPAVEVKSPNPLKVTTSQPKPLSMGSVTQPKITTAKPVDSQIRVNPPSPFKDVAKAQPEKFQSPLLRNGQKTMAAIKEFTVKGEDGRNFGDNVADMAIGNTARLANTANSGLIQPIRSLASGKSEAEVSAQMDRELHSDKGGLLGVGTFFPSKERYKEVTSNPLEFAKGFAGAGTAVATEVVPMARGTSLLAKPGLSTAEKVVRGTVEGGAYGAAGTAGTELINEGELSPLEIAKGAVVGAAMGGGIPALGTGAKNTYKNVQDDLRGPVHQIAEETSGLPRVNVLNDNEAYTLSDYADIVTKRYEAPNDVRNKVVMQARQAAKNAGFDITNLSPADADKAISAYLERRDMYNSTFKRTERQMLQGGYAKIPKKKMLLDEAIDRGLISKGSKEPSPQEMPPSIPARSSVEMSPDSPSLRAPDQQLPDYNSSKMSVPEQKAPEAENTQKLRSQSSESLDNSLSQSANKEVLQEEALSRGLINKDEIKRLQDEYKRFENDPEGGQDRYQIENKLKELNAAPLPKDRIVTEAKRRNLIDDSYEARQSSVRDAVMGRANDQIFKGKLQAEAERRGLLARKDAPEEVFGPKPTFPTIERTAAKEFYDGATKRSDLTEDIEIADPTPIKQVIDKKVGSQFAKPNDALRMSGGKLDDIERGTIVGESKGGNQRKRVFLRPDGQTSAVIESKNADGTWTEMKEPAIADAGDVKGIDALEGNEDLNAAAIKAMDEGTEIHMFAEKNTGDPSSLSATVREFDPERHIIDGGFVRDANSGAILGNHIKIDDTGIAINIGKKMVNMLGVTGDPSKWKNMNKSTYTMDRILEAAAPSKEVYKKTRQFIIEHKQSSEANMRGDLSEFRNDINKWRSDLLKVKPGNVSKKQYMEDMFFFAEKKLAQSGDDKGVKLDQESILRAKYGKSADEIIKFDNWAREQYDTMLDRTNEVLRRFGHAEVPKRNNYMTHLQEDSLWDKIGIGEDLYRDLSSGINGEANPTNRAGLPGTIAGKTEEFKPTKKYNPFHQTRRGTASMTDPFKAMDAYGEAALFNIHMTESAVRARSVESVFRAAEEIVQKDMIKQVNQDLRKSLKESMGGGRGDLVVAFQEYANALAGKSNKLDRTLQDGAGAAGRTALRVSRLLQKIASNSSIVGSASVTLAQTLNTPNVIGTNGIRNYVKGVNRMMSDITISGEPKPGSPAAQSDFLKVRYTDAQSKINASGLQKANSAISSSMFMPQVERAFSEIAWQSSYEKTLSKGLTGNAAVKEADRIAERIIGGRGIGDQPDIYRSTIGRTFLQYTLEVNAALKNVTKDMTPYGMIKYAAAVFAINYGMNQLTGRSPLPDFIGATVDTVGDFADSESYNDNDGDDKADSTILSKSIAAGQRFATEAVAMNPWASATAKTILSDDARKALFGADSDLSRYDGSPAAAQVVSKLIQGAGDLFAGNPGAAWDKALAAVPYGGQIRKTTGGIGAMTEGVVRDSKGQPMANVDTSNPFTWVQAILFGKNAIPEVKTYFNNNASSLGEDQTKTFDKLKASEGIESAKEYLSAIVGKREASKDDSSAKDTEDYTADEKVNLADGTWEKKDGVIVDKDTGEVVRSHYKKIAKSAADSGDQSEAAYDAFVKGYGLKEKGGGKAAVTGDAKLDQLNQLSGIDDEKDVVNQALSLIKKSNDGYDKIPGWVTDKYLEKNNIAKDDALYAAKASYSNDTKLPVVKQDIKGKDHNKVLDYLASGRVESLTGNLWVTQGVLADLRDQGVISKSEYTYLNKLKLNKDGSEAANSTANDPKGGKGGKAKTVSADEIKAANSTTDLEKAIAEILKRAGARQNAKKISYKRRT